VFKKVISNEQAIVIILVYSE